MADWRARMLETLYPRRWTCVPVEFWPAPTILNQPFHGWRTKFTGSGTLTATVTAGDYYLQGVRWEGDRNRWAVRVQHRFGGRYRTVEEAVAAAQRLRGELGVPQRRCRGTGSVFYAHPYVCKSGRRMGGRWVVDIPLGGKRIRRSARTEAEAERLLAELMAEKASAVTANVGTDAASAWEN